MIKTVITRDNNKIAFDKNRIIQAIEKAFRAVNTSIDKEFCINTANSIEKMQETELTVNDIQNLVEESLMKSKYDKVAKAYIIYSREREVYRKRHAKQMVTYNEIIDVADTNVKNDNANINGNTPAGQMMKFASETTKPYALDYLLNQDYANAHEKGVIHIHDLDYFPTKTTTCVQHDLNKLFKNGFDTGHGYLREPQSIRSYGALAAISFQANQNEQHGGQSIPAFDHFMAPGVLKSFIKGYKNNLKKVFEIHYFMQFLCGKDEGNKCMDNVLSKLNITTINRDFSIADQLISIIRTDYAEAIANTDDFEPTLDDTIRRYDELAYKFAYKETVKETNQSMEAFLANMNSMHSRGGGQIVFSSVNYGTDFSPEGRLVTSSLLHRLEEGLGRGETPIFPIHIFKVKEGLNFSKEDLKLALNDLDAALNGEIEFKTPNFDLFLLACKVSSKRLFPNFLFLDAPFNKHEKWDINDPERFKYEVSTMGCRTRVFEDLFGEKTSWSRGNLSFTTVNLVRLAILAKQEAGENEELAIQKYFDSLNETCNFVAEQLYDRYKFQCTAKAKQFPFLMGEGLWTGGEEIEPNQRVEEVLKHGTLGVGYIGLAEALKMLIGEHHGESDKAQDLGLKIVSFINDKCQQYKKDYNLNYSCLATPAEGISGRFTMIDRKEFGIIPEVTDRDYYTNSNHIPVYFPISAHEKIKREAVYHILSPGGHITYIEMDTEAKKNLKAFVSMISCMFDNNIGYGSINHPVDRCTVCGYEGEIEHECPNCGEEEHIDRIRRITGYLVGTIDRWNSFKKAEERDRVKHKICEY